MPETVGESATATNDKTGPKRYPVVKAADGRVCHYIRTARAPEGKTQTPEQSIEYTAKNISRQAAYGDLVCYEGFNMRALFGPVVKKLIDDGQRGVLLGWFRPDGLWVGYYVNADSLTLQQLKEMEDLRRDGNGNEIHVNPPQKKEQEHE